MLQAITHGKAARVTLDGQKQSWRSLFKTREDLITSSVFERLPYLPDTLIAAFMTALMEHDALKIEALGDYKEISFWPRYASANEKRSYTEPDLVIEFTNAIIVVEVKPPWGAQDHAQWEREVAALIKQEEPSTALFLLAIGGQAHNWRHLARQLENDFADHHLNITFCTWNKVSQVLLTLKEAASERDKRILDDQLQALELHGIHKPLKPLDDLLKPADKIKKLDLTLLAQWDNQTSNTGTDWTSLTPLTATYQRELLQAWH